MLTDSSLPPPTPLITPSNNTINSLDPTLGIVINCITKIFNLIRGLPLTNILLSVAIIFICILVTQWLKYSLKGAYIFIKTKITQWTSFKNVKICADNNLKSTLHNYLKLPYKEDFANTLDSQENADKVLTEVLGKNGFTKSYVKIANKITMSDGYAFILDKLNIKKQYSIMVTYSCRDPNAPNKIFYIINNTAIAIKKNNILRVSKISNKTEHIIFRPLTAPCNYIIGNYYEIEDKIAQALPKNNLPCPVNTRRLNRVSNKLKLEDELITYPSKALPWPLSLLDKLIPISSWLPRLEIKVKHSCKYSKQVMPYILEPKVENIVSELEVQKILRENQIVEGFLPISHIEAPNTKLLYPLKVAIKP